MTKQNKLLLGLCIVGVSAYFLMRKKKSFANLTAPSTFDTCISNGGTAEVCCKSLGGTLTSSGACAEISPTKPTTPILVDETTETEVPPVKQPPIVYTDTTTTTTPTPSVVVQPTTIVDIPMVGAPISGGGGGGAEEVKQKIFDWIPYILGGTTLVLAYIQERQTA